MEFKVKEVAFILVLGVIISALGLCNYAKSRSPAQPQLPVEDLVVVHVAGQVKTPGVYTLPVASRVGDAIAAAGGETDEADLHRLNLAAYVFDGQKISVPRAISESESEQGTKVININTADQKTLENLPGIGPAIAAKIIEYREKNGAFLSIEEIINVDRIGVKTFENIKDLIVVD